MRHRLMPVVLLVAVTLVVCVIASTKSKFVLSGVQSERPSAQELSDTDFERSLLAKTDEKQVIDSEERGAIVEMLGEGAAKMVEHAGIAQGAEATDAAQTTKVVEMAGVKEAANVEMAAETAKVNPGFFKRMANKIKAFFSKISKWFRLKKGKPSEGTTKDVDTVYEGTTHAEVAGGTSTEKIPIITDRSVDARAVKPKKESPDGDNLVVSQEKLKKNDLESVSRGSHVKNDLETVPLPPQGPRAETGLVSPTALERAQSPGVASSETTLTGNGHVGILETGKVASPKTNGNEGDTTAVHSASFTTEEVKPELAPTAPQGHRSEDGAESVSLSPHGLLDENSPDIKSPPSSSRVQSRGGASSETTLTGVGHDGILETGKVVPPKTNGNEGDTTAVHSASFTTEEVKPELAPTAPQGHRSEDGPESVSLSPQGLRTENGPDLVSQPSPARG